MIDDGNMSMSTATTANNSAASGTNKKLFEGFDPVSGLSYSTIRAVLQKQHIEEEGRKKNEEILKHEEFNRMVE